MTGALPMTPSAGNISYGVVIKERARMGVQIIMDGSGDTRHEFDSSNRESVARAERRFKELTGKGFRAVALGRDEGSGELIRSFDPNVEQTLFIPQLRGG
jgi:hypothetical protein